MFRRNPGERGVLTPRSVAVPGVNTPRSPGQGEGFDKAPAGPNSSAAERVVVLLDFSMTPLGKGESVSPYVARCLEVVAASGLDYRLHAMGTTLEGELDEVLTVVRRCFEVLQSDCDRISCSIKFDYRKGPGGRLEGKVRKVEALLGRPLKTGDQG